MKVWTVANQKGGVGKTTTTVSLGGLLSERGQRVLLVDLDPHASLTYYFNIDTEALELTAYDLFKLGHQASGEQLMQAVVPSGFANLDVLPSSMALATLDRKLGSQGGMGLVLRKMLRDVTDVYDVVIIDVPPVLGVLMVNALAACERVLIPVQTEFLALKGLERMMKTLQLIQQSRGQENPYTIIPTLYDKRTNASMQAYDELVKQYGKSVWSGMIPIDTKFRDASHAHQPPSIHEPRARGVFAYQSLLTYLLQFKGRDE
ncbi:cobalamin biosynthesis protein CobQ [Idiomarina tyrosinivorans]|uniref:Cobalamin biosynthesis protein CobQ n=1 Tax=Idiomarina tyrosinivorans TaxID=1445662 RepID=A0A432ZPH8_9GAMM|nr:ParA family protein [Idiomarina tyrosinivorans]RUO79800.1 cobalamin biosynthesis protein CobQ [Idiomarina tyrosinivorans]